MQSNEIELAKRHQKTATQQACERSSRPPEQLGEAATNLDANSKLFLAALFNKYRTSLYRYLSGLVSNEDDAAELVQESYARLLRQTNVLRLEVVARTYLFQTATNLARDHFRRQASRHATHHVDVDDEPIPDLDNDPEKTFAWIQTIQSIKQGIKELPPVARKVFLLSRFRNKTYPQIAVILGISTRTVERKMSEAMELLARHVGEGT
jgi:RNA polymerase sigma factor (sigma-70 family)